MEGEAKTLDKIAAETAAEVCESCELTEEARELLSEETAPAEFLEALAGADLLPDAIRFLAHALAKRDAVRWACDAAESSIENASEAEIRCLESARKWLEDDSESNQRAAMEAAEAAGYSGAAEWAAAAAGWSGGSMAPADLEDVPPPEHLTATAAASAVLLASVTAEPHLVKQAQGELLTAGLDLASEPPD